MQPDVKLSKFMFHLKFSSQEDYVHEHELYEVMRSRNLYQYQFSVRSNFQKRMRNIEISEKAQRYGFENSRKLFVQKMKERREHTDKLREKNNTLMKKLRTDLDDKKATRRYVPIPASTIVYEELPSIIPTAKSPVLSMNSVTHRSEGEGSHSSSPVQAPTPSAITGTIMSGHISKKNHELNLDNEMPADPIASNTLAPPLTKKRGSIASARSGRKDSMFETNTSVAPSADGEPTSEHVDHTIHIPDEIKVQRSTNGHDGGKKDEETADEFVENNVEYERKRHEFESRAIRGHGKQHTSTVHFSEDPPTEKGTSQALPSTYSDSVSKIETWRERHGLVSKTDFEKDTTFGRLMIDRPSKWALSHVHTDIAQSNTELGMRYQMLKTSLRKFDNSYKKKSQQLDDLSMKLKIKSTQKLSLPDLDTAPKPMVTLDPGGTTPDGRLILTKADYDDYLSDYKKARVVRLERSKKKAKLLYKLIENFNLDPHHRLRDETDLKSGVHTI